LEALRERYGVAPPSCLILSLDDATGEILAQCERHLQDMAGIFQLLRLGQLEIKAMYDMDRPSILSRDFGWRNLSIPELMLCPPCVVMAHAARRSGSLAAKIMEVLATGMPLTIIAVQSSLQKEYTGGVPDLELLLVPCRGIYVLQALSSAPDFKEAVSRAILAPRPALVSVLDLSGTSARAEQAVASRAFPLLTYDPSRGTDIGACLDLSANPEPEAAWTTMEPPDGDGTGHPQAYTFAHFAAWDEAFASEFSEPPPGLPEHRLTPWAEYLARPEAQRGDGVPYVSVPDREGRSVLRIPSRRVMAQTMDSVQRWGILQQLAGINQPGAVPAEEKREPSAPPLSERDSMVMADVVRRLVAGLTGVSPDEIRM
jgi:pyruvate-ferredoxin/flavodoxin oxidoreductase